MSPLQLDAATCRRLVRILMPRPPEGWLPESEGEGEGEVMERSDKQVLELSVSDQSQLISLREVLSLAGQAKVIQIAGEAVRGEQGALDVLAVVASSSGLVAAINVLPQFLRSRRTALSITTTVKGEPFTLTATNVDKVMPILEKLLNA
jgi:hypothetical protein